MGPKPRWQDNTHSTLGSWVQVDPGPSQALDSAGLLPSTALTPEISAPNPIWHMVHLGQLGAGGQVFLKALGSGSFIQTPNPQTQLAHSLPRAAAGPAFS